MSAGLLLPILWYVMKKQQENIDTMMNNQKERDKELLRNFENGFK